MSCLGGHVDYKVHHTIAVAKFTGLSGNEFDKVVIEGYANPSIKGGEMGVTVKVARANMVLNIAQDVPERAL